MSQDDHGATLGSDSNRNAEGAGRSQGPSPDARPPAVAADVGNPRQSGLTTASPIERPQARWISPERRANARRKAWLIEQLGGKCARCQTEQHLQFDCIHPQGPKHHDMAYTDRLNWYVKQYLTGNLQLLCVACHTEKTLDDLAKKRLTKPIKCPHCLTEFYLTAEPAREELHSEINPSEGSGPPGGGRQAL